MATPRSTLMLLWQPCVKTKTSQAGWHFNPIDQTAHWSHDESKELDEHLGKGKINPIRKNGCSSKTVKSSAGSFELNTPRDRSGTFEPQLVKKHQTHLTDEVERKILALSLWQQLSGYPRPYSRAIRYRYIQRHAQRDYRQASARAAGLARAWSGGHLSHRLAGRYSLQNQRERRYISKAIYTILALNIEGKRSYWGFTCRTRKVLIRWLSVLTDLYNRGVKDIMIACVDGLKGFPEAIETIYPKTEIQHCIIHQIRNS